MTKNVETTYSALITQTRQPLFYTYLGVPDTLEGRFELICLHMFLVLYRLRSIAESASSFRKARDFGQALYDHMFADFDSNFREMGVGDLRVGKFVKQMVQTFHARLKDYTEVLSHQSPSSLEEVLQRSILAGTEATPEQLGLLATYIQQLNQALHKISDEELLTGNFIETSQVLLEKTVACLPESFLATLNNKE